MEDLEQSKQLFLEALRKCPTYKMFLEKREELDKEPEKRRLVNQIRRENYLFYNSSYQEDYDQKMDELLVNEERLREDPLIDEYLEAELAVCRLAQRLTTELMETIDMNVDFL